MIARPDWFQRRKYGGWGVSPKTWQGWVYTALAIIPFIIFQSLPFWNMQTRMYVTIGWILFLFLDVGSVMISLKRDEREYKIEAISERNAAWTMMFILVVGILYEIIRGALSQSIDVNLFLVAALFGGVIAKTISNIILEKRSL